MIYKNSSLQSIIMNDYYKVSFAVTGGSINEYECDILAALLGENADFESFDTKAGVVIGYVKQELYSEEKIKSTMMLYPFESKIAFEAELIPGEDWNKEWEKNYFQPILIADRCVIHSSFHKDYPHAEYDIVINPKMAFGTGHHETTTLMITQILDIDMTNMSVLDMGTGTGVLAILSAMRGAKSVKGVEIDEMAYENAIENIEINSVENIVNLVLGDASAIMYDISVYDYVFANINRNIIVEDIDKYSKALKTGGYMQLSGFYIEDIPIVEDAANRYGLTVVKSNDKNRWAMLLLKKEK